MPVLAGLQARPLLADGVLTALLVAVSLQPLLAQQTSSCGCTPVPLWGWLLVAATCLPVLARRRQPFLAALTGGALTAAAGLATLPEAAIPYAGLVTFYSVAAHGSRRASLGAAGLAAVLIPLTLLADHARSDAQDYAVQLLTFATAWLLGDSARSRWERERAAQARAAELERRAAEDEQRAVVAERTRIAREMHDVVAHSVSLMVVQADAGPVVVGRDPERAVAAFDAIATTGREALGEMRRLLGVLRDPTGTGTAPQPGVERLPELVRSLADAGLPVELTVTGTPVRLPPAVDLSAYRVVQEALTNTLRHARPGAGPVRACVRLHQAPDALHVDVVERGAAPASVPAAAGGGLVGMRERAGLVGGEVVAGPADGGGWAVRAVLPLAARPVP